MAIKEAWFVCYKQTCGCLVLRSFCLNKKNQKFKQFGSPPGGIQACAPVWRSGKRLCLMLILHVARRFVILNLIQDPSGKVADLV
ncbi:MAG: hypothetical protein EOP42_19055 [Sphingobacteriaceae bacterium]|nr:MAG: hypothetical protein EOP42_19055 [Sphingobacteriaceae bacterium]